MVTTQVRQRAAAPKHDDRWQAVLARDEAHDGEFVLNRNAVDRIGVPTLDQANSGGDLGGVGHVTVNIHTPDKSGVEELLRNNSALFKRFVTSVIRQGVRDGNGFGFSTT